jgi:hypothetical protein
MCSWIPPESSTDFTGKNFVFLSLRMPGECGSFLKRMVSGGKVFEYFGGIISKPLKQNKNADLAFRSGPPPRLRLRALGGKVSRRLTAQNEGADKCNPAE